MSLLPPELLAGMNSGELELDFENLDQVGWRRHGVGCVVLLVWS
jgi:hypothetical protein